MIRPINKSDFLSIKSLVKELYDSLDEKAGMEAQLGKDKFEEILKETNTDFLVGVVNGKVVGYLTLNFDKAFLDKGTSAVIHELVISKTYRGKGVGKKLVKAAIDKCKQRGCSEIGVGTEITNARARKFYEGCGFKEIGVIFEKILS